MSVLGELEEILEKERHLILAAQFDDLERLAVRKSLLANRIDRTCKAETARVDQLRAAAERNDALLHAAAQGLKSAIRQIADARSLGDQTTYAADGSRNPIARRAQKLHQRL
ncbi:MAG: hypothetical protein ACR2OY_12445 [Boseongicola sp.]